MSIFDLIIIYLALGAPIAVHFFLEGRMGRPAARWRAAAIVLVFWLPELLRLVRKRRQQRLSDALSGTTARLDAEVRRLIAEIAHELGGDTKTKSYCPRMFDIKRTLERYAGLGLAVTEARTVDITARQELFRIAGRTDAEVAAACLNRRNVARLVRHQIDARADFLTLLESSHPAGCRSKALRLAKALGDEVAIERLSRLDEPQLNPHRTRRDPWNPEPRTSKNELAA